MAGTSVVRGKRLRVTRVGDGGLPQAGKRSTIVTKGFITVSLNNNMKDADDIEQLNACLLYTSPSPRDQRGSRMPSSA